MGTLWTLEPVIIVNWCTLLELVGDLCWTHFVRSIIVMNKKIIRFLMFAVISRRNDFGLSNL